MTTQASGINSKLPPVSYIKVINFLINKFPMGLNFINVDNIF